MKNLTVEQKIEKLEKKAFEIKLKIDDLKHEQELDEKRKAFYLIMELGEKHNLFKEVETELYGNPSGRKIEYKITMDEPIDVDITWC